MVWLLKQKETPNGNSFRVSEIRRDEDLRQIKAGPISILTGKNLRRDPPADEEATQDTPKTTPKTP